MVDETQLTDEQELLRIQMELSREALGEKIERLEEKVAETVQNATATVADATAAVMETVQNASTSVSDTVDSVTEAVQGTVDSVRTSVEGTVNSVCGVFDWRRHFDSHPLLMFTGAVAIGYAVGSSIKTASSRAAQSKTSKRTPAVEFTRPVAVTSPETPFIDRDDHRTNGFCATNVSSNGATTNGAATNGSTAHRVASANAPSTTSAIWGSLLGNSLAPEMSKLQELAVGTILSSVRDLIVRELPQPIRKPLAEIIDGVTEKLGGKSLQGPLFETNRNS